MTAVTTPARRPVATASASRCTWRRMSSWTARATGRMSRANSASGGATATSTCGRWCAAALMSVSTPAEVALAARPATDSSTIPMQDVVQRSKSTGLRMRRSSWSSTWTSPGCVDVT